MKPIFLVFALLLVSLTTNAQGYLPEVVVAWQTPTVRDSGAAFEVGGYNIIYRRMTDAEWTHHPVTDPNAVDQVIPGLEAGDYEFAMAVYDAAGCYSHYNQPQQVTIQLADRPQTVIMTVSQNQEPSVDEPEITRPPSNP